MSVLRTAGIGLVAVLLVLTVSAGTVVVAAEQTVLDGDYVSETLEAEGGYDFITERVTEQIAPADGSGGGGELPINQSAVMQDAVTEAYIAQQGNANIDRFYAYLHGDRGDPGLRINTTPVKENVGDSVEERLREREPHELLALAGTSDDGGTIGEVDAELIEQLDAGPDAYGDAQAEFESDVRERVVAGLVEEAFVSATDDELLALVIEDYDPNAYSDAEKERMIDDREPEIRTALEDRIRAERSDEINATVDSQMEQLRESVTDSSAGGGDTPEGIAEPALDLQTAVVRALTGDIGYETYRQNSLAARDDLSVAAADLAQSELEELPAQVRPTEELGQEQRNALSTAATAVQWVDRLSVILPVLALVLVGGVWFLSRSVLTTASVTGLALVFAGGPLFATGALARSLLETRLPDDATATLLLSVLDGFFGSLRANALVLVVVGVALLLAYLVTRYGVDGRVRGQFS